MLVQRGVPASAVEKVFFLGGVPVDPIEVTYLFTDPDGVVGIDEDGLPVTGRAPIKTGNGRFHAGNTVLSLDAKTGGWTVTWEYRKVLGGALLSTSATFEVVKDPMVEATRDGTTRRDVPDSPHTIELRSRLKDNASDDTRWAFFNTELIAFLDRAVARHTQALRTLASATPDDMAMAFQLAHVDALHALATDRTKFFRWQDSGEGVDKSMQPTNLVAIAKNILSQYNADMKRRLEESKAGVSTRERAGDLLIMRRP